VCTHTHIHTPAPVSTPTHCTPRSVLEVLAQQTAHPPPDLLLTLLSTSLEELSRAPAPLSSSSSSSSVSSSSSSSTLGSLGADYSVALAAASSASSMLWALLKVPGGVEALLPVALPSSGAPEGGGAAAGQGGHSMQQGGAVPALVRPVHQPGDGPLGHSAVSLGDLESGVLGRR